MLKMKNKHNLLERKSLPVSDDTPFLLKITVNPTRADVVIPEVEFSTTVGIPLRYVMDKS